MKRYDAVDLRILRRLVVQKIFDPKGITDKQHRAMDAGLAIWTKRDGKTDKQRRLIFRLLNALVIDEGGGYEKLKETIREKALNYWDVYYL